MDENMVEYSNILIKSLEECEEAGSFLEPVDYKTLGLFDYPRIIKHPMDLSTCKKKLKKGKYNNIEKLLKDISQIWENCRIYNQPGSLIVQQADFMEEFQKMFLLESPLPTRIPQKRSREEITFEKKIYFTEKVRKTPLDMLIKIFGVVENKCKSNVEKIREYFRMWVDKMDKTAFETIENLLNQEAAKKEKKIVEATGK
ncbi:hypothetical protein SteCoe_24541 [Stentor coeruleus]|uniref:Bromo domain-containing protein n=1 Tax=Stentor coeruleus TaxID=5963 RepID=A0A1R2BH77_9CILI|nr:hypothetical protein SteCoe_24541 [Stentor coeruleus]